MITDAFDDNRISEGEKEAKDDCEYQDPQSKVFVECIEHLIQLIQRVHHDDFFCVDNFILSNI